MVIKQWSKQWGPTMAKAPPYYKEAAGWMLSVGLARVYAHGSPFPLHTYTDHLPLTFVRSTSGKGPVSQFVLDHLSDIDYIIEYKRGPDNKEADAASRYPCLGPRLLTDIGTLAAVRTLLEQLPNQFKPEGRIWVSAQTECATLRDTVSEWQRLRLVAAGYEGRHWALSTDRPSPDRIAKLQYAYAVWAPAAERAVTACAAAFKRGLPFSCLIPNTLVHQISRTTREKDVEIQQMVDSAPKIALLNTEMTWISHGIGPMCHSVHAAWTVETFLGSNRDLRGEGIEVLPPPFTQEAWLAKQQ